MSRRLHIGGHVRTTGWEVLDANPGACVDHVGNAGDLGAFADGTFQQVYASHVLEHFDYQGEQYGTQGHSDQLEHDGDEGGTCLT